MKEKLAHPVGAPIEAMARPVWEKLRDLGFNVPAIAPPQYLATVIQRSKGIRCSGLVKKRHAEAILRDFLSMADPLALVALKPIETKTKPKGEGRKRRRREKKKASGGWWSRYHEHITSQAWFDFRERIISARGGKCERCSSGKGALHLHHLNYSHLGNERPEDVQLLCVPCHQAAHPGKKIGSEAARNAAKTRWGKKGKGK